MMTVVSSGQKMFGREPPVENVFDDCSTKKKKSHPTKKSILNFYYTLFPLVMYQKSTKQPVTAVEDTCTAAAVFHANVADANCSALCSLSCSF